MIRLLSMMRGGGISWGWFVLVSVFGVAIYKLNTNLLGEGQLNVLASRGSKLGDALFRSFCCFLDLWDSDALLSSQVFTRYSHQRDRFVDTGFDWLGVGNLNSWFNNGNYRNIVASLLSNFLAVIVSISMSITTMSMSIPLRGRLADGNHLNLALLVERNLNSLGSGFLSSLLIRVSTDLIVNLLNAFGTDCTGHWVALLFVNNFLDGKLNWVTDSLESRGANLCRFDNILN